MKKINLKKDDQKLLSIMFNMNISHINVYHKELIEKYFIPTTIELEVLKIKKNWFSNTTYKEKQILNIPGRLSKHNINDNNHWESFFKKRIDNIFVEDLKNPYYYKSSIIDNIEEYIEKNSEYSIFEFITNEYCETGNYNIYTRPNITIYFKNNCCSNTILFDSDEEMNEYIDNLLHTYDIDCFIL